MAVSSLLFRLLVARIGASRLRSVGLTLAATAGIGLVAAALFERIEGRLLPLGVPWALLSCVVFAMGLVIPASTALGQSAGDRARGTASALLGGLAFFSGALLTPLTGFLGYTSMLPMALPMAGFFIAALGLAYWVRRSVRVAEPLPR
jgi:DHA1 family bicyclomycin/chloramphenicol resistance-like MFS transporter